MSLPEGTRFQVLAPVVRGRKGTYETLLEELLDEGFARVFIDGELRDLAEVAGFDEQGRSRLELARYETHDIAVVVDRLVLHPGITRRLTDSVEVALRLAEGVVQIQIISDDSTGSKSGKSNKSKNSQGEKTAKQPSPSKATANPKPTATPTRLFFLSTWPAPATANRLKSWPPGISPSTLPMEPAPTAMAWAGCMKSTPI